MAIEKIISNTIAQLASRKEGEIKKSLDEAIGEWTILDVKTRCRLIRRIGSDIETLCLDGVPILEIHPIEFGPVVSDGEKYTQTVTQSFRRLPFKSAESLGDDHGT